VDDINHSGFELPPWREAGRAILARLHADFPLFTGKIPDGRFCFETYPYLVSCGLEGRRLEAKNKRRDRRDIIRSAGHQRPDADE